MCVFHWNILSIQHEMITSLKMNDSLHQVKRKIVYPYVHIMMIYICENTKLISLPHLRSKYMGQYLMIHVHLIIVTLSFGTFYRCVHIVGDNNIYRFKFEKGVDSAYFFVVNLYPEDMPISPPTTICVKHHMYLHKILFVKFPYLCSTIPFYPQYSSYYVCTVISSHRQFQ